MSYCVNYKNKSVKLCYDVDTHFLSWRCKAYHTHEPYTVNWIESMNEKSIMYDIGSNVGGFSFIASMIHDDIEIFSFEPNIENYFIQKKTCMENNIHNIYTFNIALNDTCQHNDFYILSEYDTCGGGSGTYSEQLKDELKKSEYNNPHKFEKKFKMNVMACSLDFMIYQYGLPVPHYIKLDVDGNESLIIKGATKLLQDTKLKEIFIEIDNKINSNKEIHGILEKNGFFVKDRIVFERNMEMILYSRLVSSHLK